jgi:hypothetical protein
MKKNYYFLHNHPHVVMVYTVPAHSIFVQSIEAESVNIKTFRTITITTSAT